MSLLIKLSNDDGKSYLPGSLILGIVELVLHEDQPIGELTIDFSGRAEVLLVHSYGDMTTSRSDYKSVGYLFSQHLNLYQGKWTHRKGTYMWPFVFSMPSSAAPRTMSPESPGFFHPERPWKSDSNGELHPLPPSFSHGSRFICAVEYTLRATLQRPDRTSISPCKTLSATKAVKVQAFKQESNGDLHSDTHCATYRHTIPFRLQQPSSRIPGFLWPILCQSQLFRSRSVDGAGLDLSIRLPRTISLKKQASLSVLIAATARGVDVNNVGQQDSANGNFHGKNLVIRSFTVSLLELTQVRAGCHRASAERCIFVRKGSCIVVPLSEDTPIPRHIGGSPQDDGAADFVNLADTVDLTIPKTVITPDFSTYNIANAHFLKVSLKMEYANKSFKLHLRHIPIQVLSSDYHGLDQVQPEIPPTDVLGNPGAHEDAWIVPPPFEESAEAQFADSPPCYTA